MCGFTYIEWLALGPLVGRIIEVVLQTDVRNDVVVHQRVTIGTEIPWLLLRVVCAVLQASKFVLEVDYVVGLFIPKSSILVLG